MKLKLLDLFSGIGGFSLGLESTGYFETIGFVEKDEFCQKVLRKNFNNIPIESEVRNVKGEKYKSDIITSGFPCQPFSVAGKRKGTDDDRYLWDETIRIIRESKCKWFIGENVEGIINIQDGMVLRQVQTDLEKEGFQVQCLIIPASSIGAFHQRKRIWIIGYNLSNSNSRNVETRRKGQRGVCKESKGQRSSSNATSFRKTLSNSKSLRDGGGNSKKCRDQQWEFQPSEQKGSSFRSEAEGCSKQDKQQTWWQTQSKLCRTPDGISYELDKDRKNRLKSLGNSIVPLIARELGLAIMKAEQDG